MIQSYEKYSLYYIKSLYTTLLTGGKLVYHYSCYLIK